MSPRGPFTRAAGLGAAMAALMLAALAAREPALADEEASGERLASHAPPGYRIIEGDILIPESELGKPNLRRYSTFQPDKAWPGGIVPFAFDASVSGVPSRQMAAQAAMALIAAVGTGSNIQFVPRTSESDYIYYINDTQGMNYSPVGRQGGRQDIHISNWGNTYTICHETMHSLGFWHEQSRSDRDTYVTIHLENVCQTCCNGSCNDNFNKESGSSRYGPYDFDSVMHYSKCAFLSSSLFCAPPNYTIVVNPPYDVQWQDAIGQRNHLSSMDKLTLSFLYALPDWRFVDVNGNPGSGTFVDPWQSFTTGATSTPSGGRLFVQPGNYQVSLIHRFNTPMRIEAPLRAVRIARGPSITGAALER